jgi:tripartite-type tricarboxylate transporter receptor subunit TctC
MPFPLKTIAAATALALATAGHAQADAAADFYKDKRIDLVISSTVGGGNDLSARLIARHFSQNMPGHPGVVPRNMPGAGGVTAANHLYNIAPHDGLAIGMVQNSALFEPLFGNDKAIFDVAKFNWLGSPSKDVAVLILWHTVPVDTIEEARKRGLMLGVSGGLNATPAFYARVLAHVFDINIKMIAGYPGQSEAFLAMERGENEGYPSAFWSSLKVVKPDWIRDKKIKKIIHFGNKPHPELADVPFATDLLKDKPEMRQIMEVASAPLAVGRPMLAPPGIPAERVRALQDALAATLKDPAYLAECEKQNLECNDPTTGPELAKIIADTYHAPKATVAKLRKLNNTGR